MRYTLYLYIQVIQTQYEERVREEEETSLQETSLVEKLEKKESHVICGQTVQEGYREDVLCKVSLSLYSYIMHACQLLYLL